MFGMFQMRNWRGHRLWCLNSRRRHVGPPSIMISPTPTQRIDLLLQNVLQSPLREKKSTKGSRRARLNRTHRPLSIQPMISQVLQLGVGGSLVIAALHWYFRNPPPPPRDSSEKPYNSRLCCAPNSRVASLTIMALSCKRSLYTVPLKLFTRSSWPTYTPGQQTQRWTRGERTCRQMVLAAMLVLSIPKAPNHGVSVSLGQNSSGSFTSECMAEIPLFHGASRPEACRPLAVEVLRLLGANYPPIGVSKLVSYSHLQPPATAFL